MKVIIHPIRPQILLATGSLVLISIFGMFLDFEKLAYVAVGSIAALAMRILEIEKDGDD